MASSLFDALANGTPEKKTELGEDNLSGEFAKKVDRYSSMIIDGYMKNTVDVNRSIARIAEKENLNDDQISRMIEEVNNQIYLLKYNQMKNSPQREVDFDIAALPKIKELLKSGEANKPINQQKEASSLESAFEKKASWEGEDGGDKLNFLNYDAYDLAMLAPDKQADRKEYLVNLAAEKVASMEREVQDEMQKMAADTYTIAEALIKYDRANVNAQEVFEDICKQANLQTQHQTMVKDAITQKIAQLKEYNAIPEDYKFNVNFVSTDKVPNEFSLGKYSFMEKMATNTVSNRAVPVIIADQSTIKSVNDLINMASGIVNKRENIERKQSELNDTKNRLKK